MHIAVISDSHDNIWKLDAALEHLRAADVILHCGDICSPFMIRRLGEGLGDRPVHVVWGNNDGDKFLMAKVAQAFAHITLHGEIAQIELDGLAVALNHYPVLARGLALTHEYRLVCYGHDHTARDERLGDCLLLNPGELMGMGGHSTLAVVDSVDLSVTRLEVGG